MPRSQRNDNFIDKTFTIFAEIILKTIPINKTAKEAFNFYRVGLESQSEGEYAEALINYYEALRFEKDPFDRSYILYNIGLIHTSNGKKRRALEYYFTSLDRNPNLTQAINNVAVIYHSRREKAIEVGNFEVAQILFSRAKEYWKEAIRISPTNYIEAQNWLFTKSMK